MMQPDQWTAIDWMVLATRRMGEYSFVVAGARREEELVFLDMYVQESGRKSKVKYSACLDVKNRLITTSVLMDVPFVDQWKEAMLNYLVLND